MKFNVLLISSVLLASFAINLTAQDWQWEADYSFLTPHVDPEAVLQLKYGPTAFYDLDNDGVEDPIAGFAVLDQEGDFPNISWRIREQNCFDGLEIDGEDFYYESPVFQDLDNDNFPEVIVYSTPEYNRDDPPELRVYHNRGDYDNPDWIRDDDLFFDIIGGAEEDYYPLPHFCDWDGNGLTDLLIGREGGLVRFEQDEEGNWDEIGEFGWFPLGDAANHFVDFNNDDVLDIVTTSTERFMARRESSVRLNIGTVEEPEMSDPYYLQYYWLSNPFPYDINSDGQIDLIDGNNFILNTGENELEAMWDRPVYWGISLTSNSVLYDFDVDGVLDLVKGTDLSWLAGGEMRFDQYQLTEEGWRNLQFFGNDLQEITNDEWWEYRALKVVEMFEDGNPCLVKATCSISSPEITKLTLLEDIADGDQWDWQPVENFFNSVIDTSLTHQIPSFGDLDNDGDQDMGIGAGIQ